MSESLSAFHDFEHSGWEKAATEYDRRFGKLTSQAIAALLDLVQARPGLRLLDVACGPGHVAAEAVRRGCSVLGVDFSSEMAAIARRRYPGIEFREGDAEALDLPPGSFDAVVMNFGMLHLGAPDRAIAEAFRVLQPGGRYAFTVWDLPEKTAGFKIILNAIQTQGDMSVPLPEGPPFFRFSDPQESRNALADAGFVDVQVRTVPQLWNIESGDELLTTFRTAAVRTAALLNAQLPNALEGIRQEVVSQSEAFRRGDRIELPMPAILTGGLKPANSR